MVELEVIVAGDECHELSPSVSLYVLAPQTQTNQQVVIQPKRIVLNLQNIDLPAGSTLIVATSCNNTFKALSAASMQLNAADLDPATTTPGSRFVPHITVSLKTQPQGTVWLINAIDLERVFLSREEFRPRLAEFLDQMRVDSPQVSEQAYKLWTLVDTPKILDPTHNAVKVKHVGSRTYLMPAGAANGSAEPVAFGHHAAINNERRLPYTEAWQKFTHVDFSLAFMPDCNFSVDNIVMSQCLNQEWDESRMLYIYLLTNSQPPNADIYHRTIYHNVRILHLPISDLLIERIGAASMPLQNNVAVQPPAPSTPLVADVIQEKIWLFPDVRSGTHVFWNDVRWESIPGRGIPPKKQHLNYFQPYAAHDQSGPSVKAVPQRVACNKSVYFQHMISCVDIVKDIKLIALNETNQVEGIFFSDHGVKFDPQAPQAYLATATFVYQLPARKKHEVGDKTHFILDFANFFYQIKEHFDQSGLVEDQWSRGEQLSAKKAKDLRDARADEMHGRLVVPFTMSEGTAQRADLRKYRPVKVSKETLYCIMILDNGHEDEGTDYRVSVKNVASVRNLRTYHVHRDYAIGMRNKAVTHFYPGIQNRIQQEPSGLAASPYRYQYHLPSDRVKFLRNIETRDVGAVITRRQFVAFVGATEESLLVELSSFPEGMGAPSSDEPWDLHLVRVNRRVGNIVQDKKPIAYTPIYIAEGLPSDIAVYEIDFDLLTPEQRGSNIFSHVLRKWATPVFESEYDYPADRAPGVYKTYFRRRLEEDGQLGRTVPRKESYLNSGQVLQAAAGGHASRVQQDQSRAQGGQRQWYQGSEQQSGWPSTPSPIHAQSGWPGARGPIRPQSGWPGAREPIRPQSGWPGASGPIRSESGWPGATRPIRPQSGWPGAPGPIRHQSNWPGAPRPIRSECGWLNPNSQEFVPQFNPGGPGQGFSPYQQQGNFSVRPGGYPLNTQATPFRPPGYGAYGQGQHFQQQPGTPGPRQGHPPQYDEEPEEYLRRNTRQGSPRGRGNGNR